MTVNIYSFNEMGLNVYWKPGDELNDLELKKLHNRLLIVNKNSGSNIKHKLLDENLTLVQIRIHLKNTIISEFMIDNQPKAFLLSFILEHAKRPIVHTGLMIIQQNPGANLMGLLFLSIINIAFEKLGPFSITNITSTPSSIEFFAETVKNSWPGPDVKLKKSPPGHKEIVHKLKKDYMDNYFPDADKIKVDDRRFVLSSNSKEMGFTTNFIKISRAENFKYNLFCHTWIDYDREEDIIQVGKIDIFCYLKSKIHFFFLQRDFLYLPSITVNKEYKSTKRAA